MSYTAVRQPVEAVAAGHTSMHTDGDGVRPEGNRRAGLLSSKWRRIANTGERESVGDYEGQRGSAASVVR